MGLRSKVRLQLSLSDVDWSNEIQREKRCRRHILPNPWWKQNDQRSFSLSLEGSSTWCDLCLPLNLESHIDRVLKCYSNKPVGPYGRRDEVMMYNFIFCPLVPNQVNSKRVCGKLVPKIMKYCDKNITEIQRII